MWRVFRAWNLKAVQKVHGAAKTSTRDGNKSWTLRVYSKKKDLETKA